jgi:superfamily II DNA/RNA helicase
MKFYDLELSDPVLDALEDMNFQDTTPIQEHAIPPILARRDVLGIAQTGTGKTAAYLLPVLSELSYGDYPAEAINCIIMSPTRELAQQIDQALQGFSYHLPYISSVAVYGGNDGIRYEQEKRSMQQGADIIIATPGRLISHISLGNIDLSRVSFFILDEADRMLDMGFAEDIMQIAKQLPREHQTIMFSATMPDKIRQFAKSLLNNPVEISLAISRPAEKIHQMAYICYETQKIDIIKSYFSSNKPERVIIFTGSKIKAKESALALAKAKLNCRAMHSDLTQQERDEVMYLFRSSQIDILVATDIVARGIDIDDITLVINFDVPHDAEDYIHRIGRTARAGAGGSAITLVSEKDQPEFKKIEQFLEKDIDKLSLPSSVGEGPEYTGQNNKTDKNKRRRNSRKDHSNCKKSKTKTTHTFVNEGIKENNNSFTKENVENPNSKSDIIPEKKKRNKHKNKHYKNNHDTPNIQHAESQKEDK